MKFFGTFTHDGINLFMDRGSKGPPFEIREEWLERIEPVPGELKDIPATPTSGCGLPPALSHSTPMSATTWQPV